MTAFGPIINLILSLEKKKTVIIFKEQLLLSSCCSKSIAGSKSSSGPPNSLLNSVVRRRSFSAPLRSHVEKYRTRGPSETSGPEGAPASAGNQILLIHDLRKPPKTSVLGGFAPGDSKFIFSHKIIGFVRNSIILRNFLFFHFALGAQIYFFWPAEILCPKKFFDRHKKTGSLKIIGLKFCVKKF